MEHNDLMDKISSLAKRRGFIFQGSEIYGGLAGTWDYGPLGVALKNNVKNAWRKKFIDSRDDMYEVDAALLMNPKVWETSGHVGGFSDPMVEDIVTKKRYRADQMIQSPEDYQQVKDGISKVFSEIRRDYEELDPSNFFDSLDDEKIVDSFVKKASFLDGVGRKCFENEIARQIGFRGGNIRRTMDRDSVIEGAKLSYFEFSDFFSKKNIEDISLYVYLNMFVKNERNEGGVWSLPRQFNMMFKTQVGAVEDSSSTVYFRPETAQGMFVNFKNILDSFAPKLPFGMAQIGKAFRNEITPKDFIFRVREFEQMEIEYFIREPKTDSEWQEKFEELRVAMIEWMNEIGIDTSKVHELKVEGEDLAHYSKATTDFEFDFPFGRKELYGLAYRTNFDLKAHSDASGTKLEYFDQDGETDADKRFIPHVIEPSFGVERTVLALLTSAYKEDEQNGETRSYLSFKPSMAPVICAVSPLLKNRPELQDKAREVYAMLKKQFGRVAYDDNGNVGKRYRRQDEIGTPWCIVIDFDTIGQGENINPDWKDMVTVRDRDTGNQERVAIADLASYISSRLS